MANPRKFSEKIALHTHRQAEETARFEQIMKEVSDATARDEVPNQNMVNYRPGSRARSQGGPIRRPHDRRLDTSPYSSTFLSPPHDTSWRRTHSDSALHQSAMQDINSERNDNCNNRWMMQNMNGPERNDNRPRSSCEIPRVPGIHIYPSPHMPGTVQIPISGNNTGSLPDLTNVDFSSPIHIPLDQDADQGSSSYGSSPVNTSPSTLSPTSIPQGIRQQGRFPFTSVSHAHSNHLLVPRNPNHPNKNVPIDSKNITNLVDGTDFTQQLTSIQGLCQQQHHQQQHQQQQHQQQQQQQQHQQQQHQQQQHQQQQHQQQQQQQQHQQQQQQQHQQQQQQQQHQGSPTSSSPTLQQVSGYRSPRPSPQSSPSLGGRHSAPCSPGTPIPLPNDYGIFNQQQAIQFQHHFEQLSVLDPPVSNVSYVEQPSGQLTQTHSQTLPEVSTVGSIELTSDPGYYSTSPSQLVYQTAPTSLHTTPNTPTSIPDIILTDFSSATDEISRQDLSKQLENDFFSEESLRESLEPLNFDELQMLTDPTMNLIPDGVEDGFRLHRS